MQWFTMINIELNDCAILLKNVYNKNKIDILLSILSSLKILINTENLRNYKSTEVKWILITVIECIFINKKYFISLIIWSALTH